MRNVRVLCGLAVLTAAIGCGGSDQSGRGAQTPSQATAETPPETPVLPSESVMGSTSTPPGEPTSRTSVAQAGQNQLSSGDIVVTTFVCMLGPMTDNRG